MLILRAALPQCYAILALLIGSQFGLRDADTNESGTAPVSRNAGATDMGYSFGVT
jgi:hypothetical protein